MPLVWLTPLLYLMAAEDGLLANASPLPAQSLGLSEVLASVDRHYPELEIANLRVQAARGRELSAQGFFDLEVKGAIGGDPTGKFSKSTYSFGLGQTLPWSGIDLFAGYRNGDDFPVYYGDKVTSESGELRLGASVPLLRDRTVDEGRLQIRNSRLQTEMSEFQLGMKRLEVRMAAAQTYLRWVASGLKRNLADRLLDLAQRRQAGIEEEVRSGAIAQIDSVENQLLIYSRQERLLSAKQTFEQVGLDLSLYLRNRDGRPIVPSLEALSSSTDDVILVDNNQRLEDALAQRPDLKALLLEIDRVKNEVDWASNQLLPRLDVHAMGSKDVGRPRAYAPFAQTTNDTQVAVGVSLALPIQMRRARGQLMQRTALLQALKADASLLRDRIEVQVQQARTVMQATAQRMVLSQQSAEAAQRLEKAERIRFDAGQTSLLVVNLRELASADAQTRLIDSWAEHQLALVTFQAAVGRL